MSGKKIVCGLSWLVLTILIASAGLTGCQTASQVSATLPAPDPAVHLGPGDVLDIKFIYWPELNDTQTVRPDGKISLQMVDEVMATGLTPEQLDAQLTRLYEPKLKKPEITVVVRNLSGQRVYVGGEVRTPGEVPLKGRMTVLDAIFAAGGYENRSAQLRNVVVMRRVGDRTHATTIDVKRLLRHPDEADVLTLAPYDVVYVPRTRIDEVDQWVDQYITRIFPNTGLRFTYTPSAQFSYGYGNQ